MPTIRSRPLVERLLAGAAMLAIATGVAACGSSSHPASTSTPGAGASTTPISATTLHARVRLAVCLRGQGINVPDPTSASGSSASAADTGALREFGRLQAEYPAPKLDAALNACRSDLAAAFPRLALSPSQLAAAEHAREQNLLSFASCMRAHKVPNFPDPTSIGRLNVTMITAAGVDLHSPAVYAAAEACLGSSHGAVTQAAVERAINGG